MRLFIFSLTALAMISACSAKDCKGMEKGDPGLRDGENPSCTSERTSCTIRCDTNQGWEDLSGNDKYLVPCVDGKWDFSDIGPEDHLDCVKLPSCKKLENPTNGKVDCPSTKLDKWCEYTCNDGYDVVESKNRDEYKVKCVRDDPPNDDKAKWNKDPATCKLIVCDPAHTAAANGQMSCSKGKKLGSLCKFWCDKNFDLRGIEKTEVTSKCIDNSDPYDALGEWNRPRRECDPIKCKETLTAPENGELTYPEDMAVGSQSQFKCYAGYELVGESVSTCKDDEDGDADGVWNPSKPPQCQIKECRKQDVDNNVIEDCEGAIEGKCPIGTVCTYTCKNKGTYMKSNDNNLLITSGTMTSTCKVDRTWTRKPPHCYRITCEPSLEAPDNGFDPYCSKSNKYESSCTFNCFNEYELSHDRPVVCNDDGDGDEVGEWSENAPTCIRNVCDNFRQIANGEIFYSNGNNIGSVGTVHCHPNYTPKKYKEITCTAASATMDKPHWDPNDLVCCVECTINPRLIVSFVIDKTVAQSSEAWREVYSVVDVTIGKLYDTGNFKITLNALTYDDTGVAETLDLTEINVWEDLEVFREQMMALKYGGDAASSTGEALRQASNLIYKEDLIDEPYIVLMMGGEPADDAKDAAAEVRDLDINLLAIGFNTDVTLGEKLLTLSDMNEITGDPRNSFVIEDWNNIIRVTERMTKITQESGCTIASENQSCPKVEE